MQNLQSLQRNKLYQRRERLFGLGSCSAFEDFAGKSSHRKVTTSVSLKHTYTF
jgi:hypothetical protein